MSDSRDRLATIRAAIDQADQDLVAALDARAQAVKAFAELREREPNLYVSLPAMHEVLARARELRTDFPHAGLEPVIREVVSACAEMLAPVRVAIVGSDGGLAHLAGRLQFGVNAQFQAMGSIGEAFAAVEREAVTYAVVPLETSTDGAVSATLFALTNGRSRITAERSVPGAFHLYSKTGNIADVDKVYGTAAALAACARTLKSELPRATPFEVKSTTLAVELASEDHGGAVVAPELFSGALRPCRLHVEDEAGIHTRFLVVGRDAARRTGTDRTMIALALNEQPGALYAALQPFAERGINLTRLESRQAPGSPFEQLFFVELDGHVSDRPVLTAVDEVKSRSRHLKVLGSYPRPVPAT